jgi:hypothetical protein
MVRPPSAYPFLDRGFVIERYLSDIAGHFRLPLARHERSHAVWLICAPASLPMVGLDRGAIRSHVTYGLNRRDVRPGDRVDVRSFGWSAPIPRECTIADTTTRWRGPVDSANASVPMTPFEPAWAAHRSTP